MKRAFKLKQRLILTIFNNFIYLYKNNSYGCSSKLLPVNSKYYNREVNLSIFTLKSSHYLHHWKATFPLLPPWSHERAHPLSTYAKFSEKLRFLTPWYAHVRVHQGVRNVSFPESFAYVLNGWLQNFLTADMKGL